MKDSLLLALASLLLSVVVNPPTANATTSNGPIYGNTHDANGIMSFRGIPYAQPPVGSLRWKSPTRPLGRLLVMRQNLAPPATAS